MKLAVVFIALLAVIHPVCLQVDSFHSNDVVAGDASFFTQSHSFQDAGQCIGNCTGQSNSFLNNNSRAPHVQQQMIEAKPTGVTGFIYSAVTSFFNYLYRLFVQPWIGFVGLGQSSASTPMDRNAYTVESRSAPVTHSTMPTASDWHEIGTTAFNVLSSIFLKNKPRPPTTPSTLSTTPVQSTPASISAINPL